MKQSKIQKNFYISEQKIKNIIEKRCTDIAKMNKQSSSFIIEDKLMEGLFPKNKEARDLTINYLYSDDPNSIKNTLDAAFNINANGVTLKRNFLPLITFCLKHYRGPSKFPKSEQELYYLVEQFNFILKRINNCVAGIIDERERSYYYDRAISAADLITTLRESPDKTKPYYIIELIADFFEMIDDYPHTYNALSTLAQLSEFEESANNRIELCDILNELSTDWDKIKKDDSNLRLYPELYTNRVRFKIAKDERFADDCLAVFANEACVGYVTAVSDQLLWKKNPYLENPRYQFKCEDIFASVVAELKKYKDEHGYKYLVIDSLRDGYASILDRDLFSSVGFRQLPDNHPSLWYLD